MQCGASPASNGVGAPGSRRIGPGPVPPRQRFDGQNSGSGEPGPNEGRPSGWYRESAVGAGHGSLHSTTSRFKPSRRAKRIKTRASPPPGRNFKNRRGITTRVSPYFLGVSGQPCPCRFLRKPALECESLLSLWRPELAPSPNDMANGFPTKTVEQAPRSRARASSRTPDHQSVRVPTRKSGYTRLQMPLPADLPARGLDR